MARQYEHLHTTTVILAAALIAAGTELAASRFISLDGNYATGTGGLKDSLGASKNNSYQGSIPVITGYTGIVELGGTVQPGDFLKPADDGSGRAVAGTADEHCARVRSATAGGEEGHFIEAIILPHRHA